MYNIKHTNKTQKFVREKSPHAGTKQAALGLLASRYAHDDNSV